MEFKDYYKTLGLARTASADEIKKAYRKLVRKHHPDVSKAADATERMVELNEANAVLSDPEKRQAYDSLGQEPPAARDYRPPPHWDAGFEFSDSAPDGELHSAFFEELFGRARQSRPSNGSDHHARIELDLLDVYTGAERTIVLRGANGEERQLQVTIPKGVYEGQHIRLAGKGGAGAGGAPAGDLLLELLFKPDPRWRAEGRDVFQGLPVAPWEAMLGATVSVRTPGGLADVNIPAGWKPGRKLRLKGRGIPGTATRPAGDLYLVLELALPAAEGEAGRAAYQALAQAFPAFNPREGA
jgi:curved DNA-binding protein